MHQIVIPAPTNAEHVAQIAKIAYPTMGVEKATKQVVELILAHKILAAIDGQRVSGAIIFSQLDKQVGAIWPPFVTRQSKTEKDQLATELITHGLHRLFETGVSWVQALLDSATPATSKVFERAGMHAATTVHGLVLDKFDALTLPAALDFVEFSEARSAEFVHVLTMTNQLSLDLPELCRWLTPRESLEQYLNADDFDPSLCRIINDQALPVGIVIAGYSSDADTAELHYIGIIPEHRRRNLGRRVTNWILRELQTRGVKRVTVSVDCRNHMARALFRSFGFTENWDVNLHLVGRSDFTRMLLTSYEQH